MTNILEMKSGNLYTGCEGGTAATCHSIDCRVDLADLAGKASVPSTMIAPCAVHSVDEKASLLEKDHFLGPVYQRSCAPIRISKQVLKETRVQGLAHVLQHWTKGNLSHHQ